MAFDTPGVYINYKTDGPLVMPAVSTSTAVFIGTTVIGRSVTGAGANTVVAPTYISSLTEYSNVFTTTGATSGVVSMATENNDITDTMGLAVRGFIMNGGQHAYIVSLSTGTPETATLTMSITGVGGEVIYRVSALSAGAWGNDVNIMVTASAIAADFLDVTITLNLLGDTAVVPVIERFNGIRAAELGALTSNVITIQTLAAGDTGFAGPHDVSLTVSGPAASPPASDDANLGAGANSSSAESTEMGRVFDALRDIDDISLIVFPDKRWPANEGDYALALAHCQAMKDRVTLIQLADDATDFGGVTIPQDKFAVVYYPQVNVALPLASSATRTATVNSVGHVAGIYARTDSDRGAWTAPAGMHASISGMTSFTVEISHNFQAQMNVNNINALRHIQGIPAVWGARTRDIGGIYTYIPVMRTAILIADSLRETLNNYVFAKNTQVLWSNVKAGVNGFMDGLYAQGAFQGATSAQAFRVAVGVPESMTQDDARKGLLKINVGFAPALVAEYIEIVIEQIFEPGG